MKVAVISDSHDNIWNLDKFYEVIKDKNIDAIIHCGDFAGPFMINRMGTHNIPVHCVHGNVGDREQSEEFAKNFKHIHLYGTIGEFTLGNKFIGIVHYPDFAIEMAKSEKYNAVFFGHTHEKEKKLVKKILYLNPGELSAIKNNPSYAIYDTKTNDAEFFDL